MLMPKIDPAHEHRHFFPRYFTCSGIVVGPWKAVFLEPFHPQAKSIPIPVDDFQYRLLPIREEEQAPAQGTLLHRPFCDGRKTIDMLTHVRRAGTNEYPRLFKIYLHDARLIADTTLPTSSRSLSGYTAIRISFPLRISSSVQGFIGTLDCGASPTSTNPFSLLSASSRRRHRKKVPRVNARFLQNAVVDSPLASSSLIIFSQKSSPRRTMPIPSGLKIDPQLAMVQDAVVLTVTFNFTDTFIQ
jgi:hypothetical protein